MRKCDNYLAIQCYKYAPEQFKAYRVVGFSHGNRNVPKYEQIKLDGYETSVCGNAYCTKGRSAAISELKKIMRKHSKRPDYYVTYGFMSKTYPSQYRFTKDIRAVPECIDDILRVYKEFKQFVLNNDCKFPSYTQAVLDGNYQATKIEDVYDEVDISKPVRIILNVKY